MKFLIQKIDEEIRHDFSFTLRESARYLNWYNRDNSIKIKYLNTREKQDVFNFTPSHRDYCPVGSVEFVTAFLEYFYHKTPRPFNVPEELFGYANRYIYNGTEKEIFDYSDRVFVKGHEKIKSYSGIFNKGELDTFIPGMYQISEVVQIDSEWRGFVYKEKLVGLQNYSGDFTIFPNIKKVKMIIDSFSSAPIAYTIDFGVSESKGTFVVEVHDFFSCGLYGFADHKILPHMFYKWFLEYIKH